MSRHLVALAAAALAATAACAPDATAPAPARQPAPSALLVGSLSSYQATVLPLRYGAAINSSGAVVGTMPDGTGVYYANGAPTVLLPLTPFDTVTPSGLTNDGRIIAREGGPSGARALYYASPTTSAIDIAAPHWGDPTGLNDQGVVVGRYRPAGPTGRDAAFRWTLGSSGVTSIQPAGCEESFPLDLSESGYATGKVLCGGTNKWYRWNPGGAAGVLLPTGVTWALQPLENGRVLVRYPYDRSSTWGPTSGFFGAGPNPDGLFVQKISLNGRFIGTYTDPITERSRAWTSTSTATGSAITLPLPAGFESADVRDVNACGTILGFGRRTSDGQFRAIVWSRSMTCDTPVVTTAGTF